MKALITLFLFFMSSVASADLVSQLTAENPTALPYQVLKMLYNDSSTPAALQDFDWSTNAQSNQHCVLAPQEEIVPLRDDVYVVRNHYLETAEVAAVPGDGPLFPGSPEKPAKIGTEITFDSAAYPSKRSDSIRKLSDPRGVNIYFKTTSTDLIETHIPSGDTSDEPWTLSARKNGNLIAIHLVYGTADDNLPDAYLYCYRD
jgi:hypothetical protein